MNDSDGDDDMSDFDFNDRRFGGTLEVVCCDGKYYTRVHSDNGSFDTIGARLAAWIPEEPRMYRDWLTRSRYRYANEISEGAYIVDKAMSWDTHVQVELAVDANVSYAELPTEIPYFDCIMDFDKVNRGFHNVDGFNRYIYILNLDAEVLTINHSIHFRLDHFPRDIQFWRTATKPSIYGWTPTLDPAICPEHYMASPALPLPKRDLTFGRDMVQVYMPSEKLDTKRSPHVLFFATMAANHVGVYRETIACLSRQWHPTSFACREFIYSIVSLAAGNFSLYPITHPDKFYARTHLQGAWSPDEPSSPEASVTPFFQFGSSSHFPGQLPGAAPAETMYWMPGCFAKVLVSIVEVVGAKTISEAMTWGIASREGQLEAQTGGRGQYEEDQFYMIVTSMYTVSMVEVTWCSKTKDDPDFRMTFALDLTPIEPEDCLSTSPLERAVFDVELGADDQEDQDDQEAVGRPWMRWRRFSAEPWDLEVWFGAIIIMAKLFDTIKRQHDTEQMIRPRGHAGGDTNTNGTRRGRLPLELYALIIDHVDHNTWKALLTVSPEIRAICMRKYRIDDDIAILPGSAMKACTEDLMDNAMLFLAERTKTSEPFEIHYAQSDDGGIPWTHEWMTVIGEGDRKVALLAASQQYGMIHRKSLVGENGRAREGVWPLLTM